MTVAELTARFPEIPADLHGEPELAELAATLGPLLEQAQKPSNCTRDYSPAHRFYLELVGPMDIYRYGLSTRDKVLGQIRSLLRRHREDPAGFADSLIAPAAPDSPQS